MGRFVAMTLVERGHLVGTFNRGVSADDVAVARVHRGDRYRPNDVERLSSAGRWDVAVDTSGYVPRNALDVARVLEPVAGRYVFMSTMSVYAGWPVEPLD